METLTEGKIKCPFCAEEIQEEAIKCKHCGEFLINRKGIDFGTCTDCGELLENDSGFCNKCGALQIDESVKIDKPNLSGFVSHASGPKKRNKLKEFLWFGGFIFILLMLSKCPGLQNITENNSSLKGSNISKPDYEHDLTERCKDWIFYRNRAYKLGKEGDQKGSAEASKAMKKYNDDLRLHFSDQQISDEISRLEATGYNAGF